MQAGFAGHAGGRPTSSGRRRHDRLTQLFDVQTSAEGPVRRAAADAGVPPRQPLRRRLRPHPERRHGLGGLEGRPRPVPRSSPRRAASGPTTARRSRSATTPGTGRSACSSGRPRSSSTAWAACRSPRTSPTRATAARRARPGCSTRSPTATTPRSSSGGSSARCRAGAAVIGIGTCDKGLPAMLMAVASFRELAGAIVPGGVDAAADARRGRGRRADARGAVRPRARHARGGSRSRLPRLRVAGRRLPVPRHRGDRAGRRRGARADRAACGARAVGPADLARRRPPDGGGGARPVASDGRTLGDVLTDEAIENAMLVHAAFGGSTNLLIHIPAIAHATGLPPAHRRGLAPGQPRRAASRRRAPERPAEPPDGARLPRRRRAGGDAPPAPARAPQRRRADGAGPELGRRARRVGGERAPGTPAGAARGGRRGRPGRRDLAARPRAREGHDLDRVLPRRQPGSGRQRHQGDRDRPPFARRRRRLPPDRPRARLHERARRDRGDQGNDGRPDRGRAT